MDEHTPVLVDEVVSALAVRAGGLYVDATFGRGGHSERILEQLGPDGRVLAIDRDPAAIAAGRARFACEPRLSLVHSSFDQLASIVRSSSQRTHCDGIVFDFGLSSPQLEDPARGFSFTHDGPLDMRMDPTRGQPLAVWLARARREEIQEVIARLGEERYAARIASAIVNTRTAQPLTRTSELSALVARSVPTREPGKHPATRTFQALRIHVNDELGQIERALQQSLELLAPGARLVTLAFHSLEDRAVKHFIRRHSELDPELARVPLPASAVRPLLRRVGRKQRASNAEVARNPRSRSAMLRVAERLP